MGEMIAAIPAGAAGGELWPVFYCTELATAKVRGERKPRRRLRIINKTWLRLNAL
jgi:hypothetical protein